MKRPCIGIAIIAGCLWVWPLSTPAFQASPFPDFDDDGVVGFEDFLQFAGQFGSARGDDTYDDRFDLDGDGMIGFPDFLIFAGHFGKPAPRVVKMKMDFPLRALHAAGNWGTNPAIVSEWESGGRVGRLIPPDYIEWLNSLYVNWVGLSVALFYRDSLDSTVERVYPQDVDPSTYSGELTFSDEALRQMIRELRDHGYNVYLTLAFEAYDPDGPRRAERWLIGNPYGPRWSQGVLPENWPWSPDHPDHQRFVAEFWETYTQNAVHFARIAQAEGVQMYSLGTETDYLFRTRSGDFWPNHFGRELKAMVDSVRRVYKGLLTYDMHASVFIWPHDYGPGSDHLWEDLDLDIVGISAYFPITETIPTSVISVADVEARYREIIDVHLKPLAERNPTRPILFLEFAAQDAVSAPEKLGYSDFSRFVFTDANDNGLDDGRETQANIYQGLVNAINNTPCVVNGVFFFDNWITSEELWNDTWAYNRGLSIKGKLAEDVIRSAYASYAGSTEHDQ